MESGGIEEENSPLMRIVVIIMVKSLSQIRAVSTTGQQIASSKDDGGFSVLTGLLLGQHVLFSEVLE